MKGQYFSFDAIVATVIMVIAMTSLSSYWFGTQAVVDSRTNPLHADAMRMADSLVSPGVPADWDSLPVEQVQQFGLTDGFTNVVNTTRAARFMSIANDHSAGGYNKTGKIMRASADYYVSIETTDGSAIGPFAGGKPDTSSASEVVVAHRGVVLQEPGGARHPARLRVILSR